MSEIDQELHAKLCAYVFGEVTADERRALEAALENDPALRAERARLEATLGLVRDALPEPELSPEVQAVLRAAAERGPDRRRFTFLRGGRGIARLAAAAVVLIVGGVFALEFLGRAGDAGGFRGGADQVARAPQARRAEGEELAQAGKREAGRVGGEDLNARLSKIGYVDQDEAVDELSAPETVQAEGEARFARSQEEALEKNKIVGLGGAAADPSVRDARAKEVGDELGLLEAEEQPADLLFEVAGGLEEKDALASHARADQPAAVPAPQVAAETPKKSDRYRGPGDTGPPDLELEEEGVDYAVSNAETLRQLEGLGYLGGVGAQSESAATERVSGQRLQSLVTVAPAVPAPRGNQPLERLRDLGYVDNDDQDAGSDLFRLGRRERQGGDRKAVDLPTPVTPEGIEQIGQDLISACRLRPGESPRDMFFRCWGDNPFVRTADDQLSTFGVDVDTASYTLARRYLNDGHLPTKEQVRTEEFVNYFKADRPAPGGDDVFAIELESAPSLFHDDPRVELLRVTVRGKDVDAFDRQPLALTFVVDVSGSMDDGGRLRLVQDSLSLLLEQLSYSDSIAVVAFRNEARVVSEMVSAARRGPVEDAIHGLKAQGGTNLEGGLLLGYELAARALTPHAVNRVVLLSDGVGNIGETDQRELLRKVERFRAQGIYLNTVGVGMGNHNDTLLEQLANQGDGLCQYIDSEREARRVLVDEFTKTLQPIARDVKIQVEFDPQLIQSYRQLGYENRAIADERFRDDSVDAGEVNAGHQVTALYEIVRTTVNANAPAAALPVATVRVRYKPPFAVDRGNEGARARAAAEKALEISATMSRGAAAPSFESASAGYRRSVLVAQFAELLRRSTHTHTRADSDELLLAETRKLAVEVDDADVTELLALVEQALPMLAQERSRRHAELDDLVDTLCKTHYEEGRRQAQGEELPENLRTELESEIERLEQEILDEVQRRYGDRR